MLLLEKRAFCPFLAKAGFKGSTIYVTETSSFLIFQTCVHIALKQTNKDQTVMNERIKTVK